MSGGWVRLATNFYRHPKALAAGPAGRNLFLAAMAWAGEFNTDGLVPAYALDTCATDAGVPSADAGSAADRLVEVTLWERVPDGWQIHDWADWQTSADERSKKLTDARRRKAEWKARKDAEREQKLPVGNAFRTRSEQETEVETETEAEASKGEPSDPPTNPPPGLVPVPPTAKRKDPHLTQAADILNDWWLHQDPRPQCSWPGAQKVLAKALRDGYTTPELEAFLEVTTVISGTAIDRWQKERTRITRPKPRTALPTREGALRALGATP